MAYRGGSPGLVCCGVEGENVVADGVVVADGSKDLILRIHSSIASKEAHCLPKYLLDKALDWPQFVEKRALTSSSCLRRF